MFAERVFYHFCQYYMQWMLTYHVTKPIYESNLIISLISCFRISQLQIYNFIMSMNSKNILKLLHRTFEDPVYDVESITTEEERSFASDLADLINDAANSQVFIDTYDNLCYNDASEIPEAVIILLIKDDSDNDFENFVEHDEESEEPICQKDNLYKLLLC